MVLQLTVSGSCDLKSGTFCISAGTFWVKNKRKTEAIL